MDSPYPDQSEPRPARWGGGGGQGPGVLRGARKSRARRGLVNELNRWLTPLMFLTLPAPTHVLARVMAA